MMALSVKILHPRATMEHLGMIPLWLDERNPKSAREQLNDAYPFGGWDPFTGFRLGDDNSLRFPGDPPQRPIAEMRLRDECILMYEHSWVAIIQPDRSFEVCRMD
jgi:hypothetical protein